MYSHHLKINYTDHKSILKISLGFFISQFESYTFTRDSEAINSPLVKVLFDFPSIKTIYIGQDYIALSLQDDYQWHTALEEQVLPLIKSHLINPESVLDPGLLQPNKNVPVSVYTENTQNSRVLKFVCSLKLALQSEEYLNASEADSAPIAKALFNFDAVKHLFINANYISITRTQQTDWMMASIELREFIRQYLMQQNPIITNHRSFIPGTVIDKSAENSLDTTSKAIISIINGEFQTALREDGGAIKFHSYKASNATLTVVAQGACRYSPAVRDSIKEGLKPRLDDALPKAVSQIEILTPQKK